MRKLVAVFAHPDDEGAVGGALAYYARQGVEVSLICTTRGEEGEISDPALATPATLGEVRTRELEAACDLLGIRNLEFLGYRDSGMAGTPANADPAALTQADPAEATGRLVGLLRRLQPDVVVTFEPFGWYGHPDHQATGRYATAAYRLAGDPHAYPEAGAVWQPRRLYHAVIPSTTFGTILDYARANNLDIGDWADRMPWEQLRATDAQVTHILDMRDLFELKTAARRAHRTQFHADGPFEQMPDAVVRNSWGFEHFILVDPEPDDRLRVQPASAL
jgi:LmbE family N-acetylglucosaminyl deacetylase